MLQISVAANMKLDKNGRSVPSIISSQRNHSRPTMCQAKNKTCLWRYIYILEYIYNRSIRTLQTGPPCQSLNKMYLVSTTYVPEKEIVWSSQSKDSRKPFIPFHPSVKRQQRNYKKKKKLHVLEWSLEAGSKHKSVLFWSLYPTH